MATQEMLRGNWNTIVGAVKERFGQITGDDLNKVKGNIDQFTGLLQRKAGQTREQVEEFLQECCEGAEDRLSGAARTASNAAAQASQYVSDTVAGVGRYASEGLDYASESAERGYEYARDVVERRPLESVALVAGASLLAGVMIGLCLSNRRS